MKRSILLTVFACLIVGFGWMLPIACGNNPTSPVPPTPTVTPTFTQACWTGSSPTCTSTFTITFTPTVTATVYTFTAQGFEGSSLPAGWFGFTNGGAYTSQGIVLSSSQAHTGTHSAGISAIFSGNNQYLAIQYAFSPPANLTGKTFSLWYYIDKLPETSGSLGSIEIFSAYGDGGGTTPLTVGAWTQASIPIAYGGVVPSAVTSVDFGVETTAVSTFNSVNLYIDDVTIQ